MNAKSLTNYYAWGIKVLLFVIPFLSLWIARSMYFPYITGRNFGFRILIELALVLWLGLIVLNKEYRPRLTIITAALAIFLVILGLANLLGVNPYRSFWSSYERMEGYMMILHLAAYFLMATTVFKTKKDWMIFFNLFLIAGVSSGFYGLLQLLGIKEAIQGGEERIDGTIGNPTYLAAYLILIIAVAFILLFNVRKRWLKFLYAAAIIFSFTILYFTASRGVTLALLTTVPILLLVYWILFRKDEKEKLSRRIAATLLAFIVILPISFWLIKDQPWVRDNKVLSRFAGISLTDKTVRSRFMIWNISWKSFKERPLLGWGQENYIKAFAKHFDPRLYDQEPWFDRSHNIVFDWLINAGILGLAAYLSLFVGWFMSLFGSLGKNAFGKKEKLILLVVPVAYFIQNLFVFDNFNTYVLFFGLLAYINNLTSVGRINESEKGIAKRNNINPSLIVTALAPFLILPIIYLANIRPALQARGIIRALAATASEANPISLTSDAFKKALAYNTFGNAETLEQLARVAKSLVDNPGFDAEAKLEFAQFAFYELEKYLSKFPEDIRMRLFAGDLYQSATALDLSYLTKARDHFKAALELSSTKQQIYYALANNYLSNKEVDKAMELMQAAVDLEPLNPEAHANKAIIAILLGRNDVVQESVNQIDKARLAAGKERDPNLGFYVSQLEKIANVYIRVQQFNNARLIYEHIVKLMPESEKFKRTLEDLITK